MFCYNWRTPSLYFQYLLLQLRQLSRQVGHESHGGLQLLLKVPDFVLLALSVAAHQRHGTHPWKPVQVVLLSKIKNTDQSEHG